MTCAIAMFSDFVSARTDQTIGDALRLLRKYGIRAVPVLDDQGEIVGRFSFRVLLSTILPGSLSVDLKGSGFGTLINHDLKLASVLTTGSEVKCAERLQSVLSVKLEDVMDTDVVLVNPTTPLWEAVRLLVQRKGPVGVVEKGQKKLIGLITVQSAMNAIMASTEHGTCTWTPGANSQEEEKVQAEP